MHITITKKLLNFGAFLLKECALKKLIGPERDESTPIEDPQEITAAMLNDWRAQADDELLKDELPSPYQIGDRVMVGGIVIGTVSGIRFTGKEYRTSYDITVDAAGGPMLLENMWAIYVHPIK